MAHFCKKLQADCRRGWMLALTAMLIVFAPAAFAQSAPTVTGTVTDQSGQPVIGATIIEQGTTNGATTGVDGSYSLKLRGGGNSANLIFQSLGFVSQTVAVNGRTKIDVKLAEDAVALDAVVAIGYGTVKQKDLTTAVSVVKTDDLARRPITSASGALQGKAAGVQVIQPNGSPGQGMVVRVRGASSISSSNDPLYVVDGVPVGEGNYAIAYLSPNEIESMQVLKDASSAAIYGSRAANGVVIITTKRGQKDQPLKVDYNGYVGMDYIPSSVYDVMDADQYSQYIGQACANSNTPLPGGYKLDSTTGKYHFQDNTNTNWFKEVFKTGIRQNHNVNLSGGGAHNTYNVSLDYYNQKGTLEGAGPNYERYTARVNNTMDTKFIKFHTSLVYSHSDQDNMGLSNASEYVQGLYGDVTNILRGTLLMQPTIKAYDNSTWVLDNLVGIANNFNYDSYGYGVYYDTVHGDISASNPLLVNNLLKRNTRVDRFVGTASADVDLLKMIGIDSKNHKLNYKVNLSYSKTHCKDFTWIPAWVQSNRVYLAKSNERLTKATRSYADALIENVLTYDATVGKHHFNLVAGQTYEEENTDLLTGWGVNFTEPYFLQLQNAANTYAESFEYKHTLLSYIGRINYNYDERYLFSATVRRDGSSRLSQNIRWGTFPSVSVGWRFDKESFFPFNRNIVNMFKVRASYGELGNENIGEYMYQAVMARNNMTYSFGNTPITGSAISTFVDNNLSWEKKKSYNVGIDLALFNNRLEFTAEWYKNTSEDLLYAVPVPEQAGVSNTTVTMNAASMNNSGFEFAATYRNRDHDFKYEVSANLSTVRNRVTSLGFGTDSYISGAYITNVGEEIGKFYGWVYDGIARTQADLDNHATQEGAQIGDCLYKDVSGPDGKPDGKVDANDQVVLGSGMPKINFGLNARFEYKRFDLSIATFGALNYHVSDDIHNSLNSCYGWGNKDVAMLDANRFSEDGSTYLSSVPRTYVTNSASLAWNDLFSDRKIQNAAYWKIANIELGYNFPNEWFGKYVSDVRFYVSAQNLHTFTGYKGYNVDYAGGTFTPGYNFCSYPTARTFMCGVHFTF